MKTNSKAVNSEINSRLLSDRQIKQRTDNSTVNAVLFFGLVIIAGIVLYACGYIDKF